MTNFEYLPYDIDFDQILKEVADEEKIKTNPIKKEQLEKGDTYEIDKNKLRQYINSNYKFNTSNESEWFKDISDKCNENVYVINEYVEFMREHYIDLLPVYLRAAKDKTTEINRMRLAANKL